MTRDLAPDPTDALAIAFVRGDPDALLRLRELLADEVRWAASRPERFLARMPATDAADLRQEAWLAIAEAARAWQPGDDGPFRRFALRALRAAMGRVVRRDRPQWTRSHEDRSPAVEEEPDRATHANAEMWSELALARTLAASLPERERAVLLDYAVGEESVRAIAARMGVSRTAAARTLHLAELRARAAAGLSPPDSSLEGQVMRAVRDGADDFTHAAPDVTALVARTGLPSRRVRFALRRLSQLGYLEAAGDGWQLALASRPVARSR